MQNWWCQNPDTPEPINMKFDVGDYVGDFTPHAKIQKDHRSRGLPAYEISLLRGL